MPRRSAIVLLSVTGHAIAIAALIILSILAPDVLPFPRQILAAPVVRVVEVPAAPRPPERTRDPGGSKEPTQTHVDVAPLPPVTPPDDVAPDTGVAFDSGLARRVNNVEGAAGTGLVQGLGHSENVAPPAAAVRPPARLHSGMEPPRRTVNRAPEYPAIARAAGIGGVVILEVIIDERGDVTAASVLRSIAVLDQSALDAVRQWKFTPARLNGEAIPIVMTVTVTFQLR